MVRQYGNADCTAEIRTSLKQCCRLPLHLPVSCTLLMIRTVEYVLRGPTPYKKVHLYVELHLFPQPQRQTPQILHENHEIIHTNLCSNIG